MQTENNNAQPNKENEINLSVYKEPRSIIRAKVKESGTITVYKITSDEIQRFIDQKVAMYAPGARTELIVRYCERKKSIPRRSYATIILGMSDKTIKQQGRNNIYMRMAESDSDIEFIDDIRVMIIKKYGYDRNQLREYLNNYKKMDELEESFGMDENFLRDNIYRWSRPISQKSPQTKDSWVLFAARPDAIIADMLTEIKIYEPKSPVSPAALEAMSEEDRKLVPKVISVPQAGPVGRLEITSVMPINKESVEFTVYVYNNEFKTTDNPELRKLLFK